jgi:ribulose-5-phosphate 4-epimerase/fuculose-1-phosphate aldolase
MTEATTAEAQTRSDLAACYRLVERFGMSDTIYTHISARLPDRPDVILLNPYGLMFDEVTASNLIAVDLEGEVQGKTAHPVNTAGFVIHSAIYAARPDVQCVIHSHTTAGMAVSALACGLLPISQPAMQFHRRIGYHDYEGLATDFDECERLVLDLGPHHAMILRNHGLLVACKSIPSAFEDMFYLEKACRTQIETLSCQRELVVPSEDVCEQTAQQYETVGVQQPGIRLWKALLRKLDAEGSAYRC